jgi:hypothetical protein
MFNKDVIDSFLECRFFNSFFECRLVKHQKREGSTLNKNIFLFFHSQFLQLELAYTSISISPLHWTCLIYRIDPEVRY